MNIEAHWYQRRDSKWSVRICWSRWEGGRPIPCQTYAHTEQEILEDAIAVTSNLFQWVHANGRWEDAPTWRQPVTGKIIPMDKEALARAVGLRAPQSHPDDSCPTCQGCGEVERGGTWEDCPTCLGSGKSTGVIRKPVARPPGWTKED